MEKPWGGRFRERTERVVEEFTASLPFDIRLWKEDIEGSKAYCRALMRAGILSEEEGQKILEGLDEIAGELERGEVELDPSWEDVHMLVEGLLRRKVGELGGKLHTGRSRNDQVVLDLRLWLLRTIGEQRELLAELRRALVRKAEQWFGILAPGYTHLRRAQPVLLSHYLMAYNEMFKRDSERLSECRKRVDIMPLGSSALSGNPYPIDREFLAELLGFSRISENSIDAVSDRDFALEYLSAISICMIHLSRMAEDLILWSSDEFGLVELPEGFCTGSSIMPQKKNPDVLELVRGKAGRVIGAFVSLATTLKGLPLAYNRDLQEDKEPLFGASDTFQGVLRVMVPLLEGLGIRKERLEQMASGGFAMATELADYLVHKGLPFREAHRIAGQIVRHCEEKGKDLRELSLEELRGFSELLDGDVLLWLDPHHALRRRGVPGGTSPERVKEAIERAKEELGL
ncbi:MAG: argininosuccinate lyase [Deltaproteobacteria bacterium]|nr:MAG: argininosuccinate lyase [Deltaproteobacteria bacterium]